MKKRIVVEFLIPLTLLNSTHLFAREHFNAALLDTTDTKVSGVDLASFEQGGQLPGKYHVDVYINQQQVDTLDLEFVKDDKSDKLLPCIPVATLKSWGIKTDAYPDLLKGGDRCVNISSIPSATSDFKFNQQHLDLSIPQVDMDTHARDYISPDKWDDGITAFALNYSVNGTTTVSRHEGQPTINSQYGNFHPGLNVGPWRFRNYSTWNHDDNGTNQWDSVYNYVSRDIKVLRSQLTLGDSNTPADVFDGIAFRGAQLASDDDMLPDSMKGYAPVIRGIARTNAEVIVTQHGYTIYKTTVAPGAFEISDMYPTGGSGDMEVTVKESDGTEQHMTVPYASLPVLRREGQVKYDVTAGRTRTEGNKEASFGQLTAIYGLPLGLTAYGGLQWADIDYLAISLGLGLNLGDIGAISADVTQSRAKVNKAASDSSSDDWDHSSGQSLRVRYSKDIMATGTNFTIAGYRYSTNGYYSLSDALDTWNDRDYSGRVRNRTEVSLSQDIVYGSVSLSYVNENYWDKHRMSSLSLSYNNNWERITYGFNYTYNLNAQTDSEQYHTGHEDNQQFSFNISVPFDQFMPGTMVSYSLNSGNSGGTTQNVSATGAALDERNLNWSVQEGYSSQDRVTSGNLYADYKGRYAELNGGYSYDANSQRWTYGAQGGVLIHRNGITLAQPFNDTVVLVNTQGAENVPVDGQTGVRTDSNGYAVIPYANPYHKNTVSLDTENLESSNVELRETSKNVIPSRGAVVVADYNTSLGRRALFTLQRPDGKNIPFGATVSNVLAQGEEGEQQSAIVGDDGQVYLTGLQDSGHLRVQWGKEAVSQCSVNYTLPQTKSESGVDILHVKCS